MLIGIAPLLLIPLPCRLVSPPPLLLDPHALGVALASRVHIRLLCLKHNDHCIDTGFYFFSRLSGWSERQKMAEVIDTQERLRQRTTFGTSESEDALPTVSGAPGRSTSYHSPIQPLPQDSTLKPKKRDSPDGAHAVAAAVAHATVPAWVNITFMLALIFGGCCANVS